ncbi:hypothetical protein QTP88_007745 [Uroleucon formosanum]
MNSAGKRVTKQPEPLTYVNILQPEIRTQSNKIPVTTTSIATLSTNAVSMSSGQSVPITDTTERDQKQIHAMFTQLMAEARSSKAERTKDKQELMSRFDQCLESRHVANRLPSSTMNPVCNNATMNTTSQGHSSFFGSQERLNDAVSKFSGNNRSLHPENFISQLDVYFENVPMSSVHQLISAQRRLSEDARIWYESLIPTPTSYIDFRTLFRQRFWSSYTRYDGLATRAMQWIAGAKYLTPPIDPIDLVSTIIQHYPTSLSMALRGRGPRDTNELLAVLTEFEESTSFCENRRGANGPRQNVQQNHQNESDEPACESNRCPRPSVKCVGKRIEASCVTAARDQSSDVPLCNQPSSLPADLPTRIVQRPEVYIDIFGIPTTALLDSGASISANSCRR